jgi:hypothetical protein
LLTKWIKNVKDLVEKCGLDFVFRIFNGKDEKYLFTHWGEIELKGIDEHVLDLTKRGVRLAPDSNECSGG